MQKTITILTIALLLPGLLGAYPGIGGGRGLFRVQNALVESEAGLTISFHVLGRNPEGTNWYNETSKGWVADLIAPELSYAPLVTKWVGAELFGSWGGVFQYWEGHKPGADRKGYEQGMHNLRAGGKLSILPLIPVLKLGAFVDYTFTSREVKSWDIWLDPTAVPGREGLGWKALATFQLQDLFPSLPNAMVNYGERDEVQTYGAGVELAASEFALFAELQSEQPKSPQAETRVAGIFDTEQGTVRLTPGVAFGSGTSGLTLKAGYTFVWGPTAPDFEVILGLVIATPFGRRAPAEYGAIAGRVVDERTGAGIAARVSFPDSPDLASLSTSAGGVFTLDRVPTGVVVVEVEADGYQGQTVPVDVPVDATAQYEFKLRPLFTYGTIAGSVTDVDNNQPLAATIEFPGTDLAAVETDPGTGAFRLDNVPTGIYTTTASADGYFKGSLTVQVEEGRVATPAFALRVLADRSTLTGKVSDKKTGEPLLATISFPDAGVDAVRSDGVTGVYMTELPVGSYAVKVSAENYLDQTAAIVIQKNQPLVKSFELVQEGMTITLRGIYFDVNKATIKPESRPALEDAARILADNPEIRVEIQGHTDSDGAASYNQQLSEHRAQSVVTYLVQNFGIAANRLVGRGYGEDQPVATNATPEGKTLNRRVEFVILGR
ncbi:MAG: carboxypeptidase regulatory-like domain-containing protein [bacterium]